jgi:threonine aldolase
MISFESDYICGAHPLVLKALTETNMECLSGYGSDKYCDSAKEKIKKAGGIPEA